MAIRKDLDDMLNNLKIGTEPASPVNKAPAPIAPVHKPSKREEKIDHMSVDDLLSTLSHEKEAPVQTAAAPVQAAPEQPKKKRIVISGDLPDYEAIRQAELEKDRAEAERRRLEAEKQAAEEAERQRLEAAKKAAEDAERQRLEAAKKAAEDAEEAPAFSFEEEINVVTSSQTEDSLGGEPTVDELMAAAFAAVAAENDTDNEAAETADAPEENADAPESDPVGNMIDTIREDAEKKLSELDETPEPEEDAPADEETSDKPENEQEDKAEERKKRFFEKKKAGEEAAPAEDAEKPKGKITSALEKIMDEDPDEIIAERSEKTEEDETDSAGGKSLKKRLYTVFGIVFAVLACVGLVTVIATAVKLLGSFTSGDSKKTGFADVVYPAVIMDIESFDEPSQLTSDQVITAAIWSMIMSDGTLDSYEKTFDVVRVPAVDVESYAVKLFGDDLPELTHTTVGPAESRFYYNEEKESYNVPLTPVTFTYSPEIKSVTKSGSEYTLTVDYIDELPEWLPKTSSKSVEFRLIQTSEGYQIKSMKVLSENNNI